MTFGYEVAGVVITAFCIVFAGGLPAGGLPAGGGNVGCLAGLSDRIIPSNFLSAS
jgi:hypothetical protein